MNIMTTEDPTDQSGIYIFNIPLNKVTINFLDIHIFFIYRSNLCRRKPYEFRETR